MAQKLTDIIQGEVSTAISENNQQVAQQRIPPGTSPNPIPPRGYASPMDVYESEVGYESPFAGVSPGRSRPMWQIPDVALTHTSVNTLKTSGTPNSTQTAQIVGGVQSNVKAPVSGWGYVPNLQLPVVATGPLLVLASVTIQSNTSLDNPSFAFYRDGNQIGQIFTQTTSNSANTPTVVSLSSVDVPPSGNHVYALSWKAGTGRLSSYGTQRSIYTVNLTPQ